MAGGMWMIVLLCLAAAAGLGECLDDNASSSSMPGIPVDYTPFKSDAVYSSNGTNRKLDAKGMQPLYAVTDLFMNLVGSDLRKDIPADLVPAEDGNIGDIWGYAKQWIQFERNVVIVAGIGVSLAILVPFFGLIFCCCRCCGKCGANAKKMEKHSDPCLCGGLTAVFVLLCLIMTFGVVCAFVTNEYMRTNVRKVNSTLDESEDDLVLYLKDTQKHVTHILVKNFEEMEKLIKDSLNDTEITSMRKFDSDIDFVGANKLFAIGDNLTRADDDVQKLNASFNRLRSLEEMLQSNLTTIRDLIANMACPRSTRGCPEIVAASNSLESGIDFTELTLSSALVDLEKQMTPSVVAQIQNARSKLDALRGDLKAEMKVARDAVLEKLGDARNKVLEIEFKIRTAANDAQIQLLRVKPSLDPYFDYINQYNQYVWYGKLTLCALVLLILTVFTLATLFGICGSRLGSLYEDPFCNKGKGACLMMCGVGLVFFLYFFIAIIITAMFLVGINLQLLGCHSIANPTANNHLKVLAIVLQQYNVINIDLKDVPQIIQKCNDNESIYDVLGLNSTYQVRGMMEQRLADMNILVAPAISGIIERVTRRIKGTKFLSESDKTVLLNLANAPWINSINLNSLKTMLDKEILKGSVEDILNYTSTLQLKLPQNTLGTILQIRRKLEDVVQNLVPEIEKEKNTSLAIINNLSTLLVEGNPADEIRMFVNGTRIAEARFHTESEPIIRAIANDTLDNLKYYISQYMNYSLGQVENVGRCGPASAAINSTIDAVCTEVLQPLNGFWLSIGWFLIILLPSLFIAIALSWHYRLPEGFRSNSSDSSDYETQTEIDTIPLAHRNARKRVHPSTLDNSAYDSRARQSKATQWAFHNAFKHQTPNGYYPVRKGSTSHAGPSAPMADDSIYTRPPSYYYPGSNS